MPRTLTIAETAELLKTSDETVSASRVRELLCYDPDGGGFTWRVTRAGNARAGSAAGKLNGQGYRQIQIEGRLYGAHRLAVLVMTGSWPAHQVDHRDGKRDNNSWPNLRQATIGENAQNRCVQANSKTGQIGVAYISSRGKFLAQIMHGGRRKTLGWFDTAEQAGAAYRSAKAVLHGFQPVPRP